MIFFFKDPATTGIYTLSLHDALPISQCSFPTSRSDSPIRARVRAEYRDFTELNFFGLGTSSNVDDRAFYRIEDRTVTADVALDTRFFDAGATVGLPAHRRVLDRRHHAVAPSVTTGGSPAGHGDRLRRPRGEDHLAATCVEHVGDLLAGGLHGVAGDHALVVDPSRISDDAGERLGHGSGRLGAQRRRGGVVEVVTGHDGRTGSGESGFQIVTSVLQTESPMGSDDRILAVVLP